MPDNEIRDRLDGAKPDRPGLWWGRWPDGRAALVFSVGFIDHVDRMQVLALGSDDVYELDRFRWIAPAVCPEVAR